MTVARLRWGIALLCSLGLTLLTVLPPTLPGDWARLSADGVYTPPAIRGTWPGYGLQIALWLGILLPLLDNPLRAKGGRPTDASCFPSPAAFRVTERGLRDEVLKRRPFPRQAWWVLACTLLGFGLRLYHLGQLPLIIDEIGFAARASDILHRTPIPVLAPAHNGNPAAFSWLMAGSMALWGQTRFAMRWLSLAVGVLTIPAAYRLGRAWWGGSAGWLMAAAVAVYPAHVHFSQMALFNIFDPLFGMLTLVALRRADWQRAGLLVGVAQYFYHGSRLLIVLVAAYTLYSAIRRRCSWRTLLRVTCAWAAPFALISLPRFAPLLVGGLPLTGNLDGVRLPPDFAANALRSLLAWVGQPDISPFWLSSQPLLPVFFLLLFLVGVGLCLRRWREPQAALLPLTLLLTTIAGGVIWPAAPLYVRYLTALPAMALLIALPLNRALAQAGWPRRVATVLLAALLLQGLVLSIGQGDEARTNVQAGVWEADSLAQGAAALPEGVPLVANVSAEFSEVERVVFADAVAAYGVRRPVRLVSP